MRRDTWIHRARTFIANHIDLPASATLADRRKALRAIGWQFHGNTYWGRKMWGKAGREHLRRHGLLPQLMVESSPLFAPDIIFPFRPAPSEISDEIQESRK